MFTKSCQYAIRAVIYMTEQKESLKNIGVKEMADSLQVPQQFLAKILQQLSKHNLISSVKGPNGGFYISEANGKVTLLDIVECIDGKAALSSCILGMPKCDSEHPCPLHHHFYGSREGLKTTLSSCEIGEMLNGKLC
ncbi:MAG: Rrf2 family transcriptional regulator [Saprospiraceae bacterium]|nr:Rrf2 family transcriptional regulator [Saprospiraceae bacterium]